MTREERCVTSLKTAAKETRVLPANQSHFHKNGFALRLALTQRHKGTRKWPIGKLKLVCVNGTKTVGNHIG